MYIYHKKSKLNRFLLIFLYLPNKYIPFLNNSLTTYYGNIFQMASNLQIIMCDTIKLGHILCK